MRWGPIPHEERGIQGLGELAREERMGPDEGGALASKCGVFSGAPDE